MSGLRHGTVVVQTDNLPPTAPGLGTSAAPSRAPFMSRWKRGEAVNASPAGSAIPGHGDCAAPDVLGSAWKTVQTSAGSELLLGPENAGSLVAMAAT